MRYRKQYLNELAHIAQLKKKDPDHWTDTILDELIALVLASKYPWLAIILKAGQVLAKIIALAIARKRIKADDPRLPR